MNRSLVNVLFGSMGPTAGGPTEDEVYAGKIKATTAEEIAMLLRSVSAAWQVGDSDLETVGLFIEFRAREVASRLRAMQLTGGLR